MSKEKSVQAQPQICFVLMPIADSPGYEPGHFGRVYEHLLKPAIEAAGYLPLRADDTVKTDYIVVGIIQKIVESAMVVCDFSSRNPNVMYELGIRHAFNKPVVLIKDRKTEKIFDIQGLRYAEYDDTLRIDAVNKDAAKITSAILETAKGGPEAMNSIVQLAGIKTAEPPEGQTITADTKLILSALEAFDGRLNKLERSDELSKSLTTYRHIPAEHLTLRNGTRVTAGEMLFKNGIAFGELQDWSNDRKLMKVLSPDGSSTTYRLNSQECKDLDTVPF